MNGKGCSTLIVGPSLERSWRWITGHTSEGGMAGVVGTKDGETVVGTTAKQRHGEKMIGMATTKRQRWLLVVGEFNSLMLNSMMFVS